MARSSFRYPDKLKPGDRVAIVSPSSPGPLLFSTAYETGLRRLRDQFELVPVEFETTRTAASPRARAADIHRAFCDPTIKGVIATAGGEDQLKMLRYLDSELLCSHAKPFIGYSDNTNLLLFLWGAGLVSYHGGTLLPQWARPGRIHPMTATSLRRALFEAGEFELCAPDECCARDTNWHRHEGLTAEPLMTSAVPWTWHGPEACVEGPAWGGNLEVIDFHLRASRYLPSAEDLDGAVLFIETSDETPAASFVYRMLMCMGERGLLERFPAVVVGRAKAWSARRRSSAAERRHYAENQHRAVLRAVAEYSPDAVVVLDVDFGHTDPQLVVPIGGQVRVDARERRLFVTY